MNTKNLLTSQEVAEILGTNATVIRESRRTGLLYDYPAPSFLKLGKRKIFYKSSEIDKYLEQIPDQRITEPL